SSVLRTPQRHLPFSWLVRALYNSQWLPSRDACLILHGPRYLRGFGSHRRQDSLYLASFPPGCFQEETRAMPLQNRPPDASASPGAGLASGELSLEGHGLYRVGLAYGRLIHHLRWLVIALWIVAVGASVPFASQLGSVLTGGGYSFSGSDSVRVGDIL